MTTKFGDDDDKLKEMLLNVDDVKRLCLQGGGKDDVDDVFTKINNYKSTTTHTIACETYRKIYVTSDIHADFRKFLQILIKNKLVDFYVNDDDDDDDDDEYDSLYDDDDDEPTDLGNDNEDEEEFEHDKRRLSKKDKIYDPEMIYDPALIANVQWTGGSSTLLVILGDLVDGHRQDSAAALDDREGTFELRLHALIHNLRIRANLAESNVLFTLGNHDVESVLTTDTAERKHMYDNYVHISAKTFFKNMNLRREMLLPFYRNSPYMFLEFFRKKLPRSSLRSSSSSSLNRRVVQYVLVHAGIHNRQGQRVDLKWRALQQRMDEANGLTDDIIDELSRVNSTDDDKMNNIFWSRNYLESKTCVAIQRKKFPLVIVGHCPTPFMTSSRNAADCDSVRKTSNTLVAHGRRGCVSVGCRHRNSADPKVIFVDTASSEVFRLSGQKNSLRDVEILKMTAAPNRRENDFYYRLQRQWNGLAHSLDPPVEKQLTRRKK
jgi:hypothetical protein